MWISIWSVSRRQSISEMKYLFQEFVCRNLTLFFCQYCEIELEKGIANIEGAYIVDWEDLCPSSRQLHWCCVESFPEQRHAWHQISWDIYMVYREGYYLNNDFCHSLGLNGSDRQMIQDRKSAEKHERLNFRIRETIDVQSYFFIPKTRNIGPSPIHLDVFRSKFAGPQGYHLHRSHRGRPVDLQYQLLISC